MRLGLVGTGRNARFRAECYEKLPDVRVVSVAGDGVGPAWSVPCYDDVESLLATEAVDAMDVCDPTVSQRAVVETCLEAGVGVVCRMPLADDVAAADAIREAADESEQPVVVDAFHRFAAENRDAKGKLDDGDLGKPTTVRTTRRLPPDALADDVAADHDALFRHTLTPDVARVRWLFGDVVRVFTRTNVIGTDDHRHAVAVASFASGAIGHFEVRVGDRYDQVWVAFEYSGTRGRISYDTQAFAPLSVEAVEQFEAGVRRGPQRPRPSRGLYERHAEHVVTCLAGTETPIESATEAAETSRTVEAALESAQRDALVPVAEENS